MNIEFLAIIVGAGVAIVLLAVLGELMALRSSVNKNAAAVKDLLVETHEADRRSVSTDSAGTGAAEEASASSALTVSPGILPAGVLAAASPQQQMLPFTPAENGGAFASSIGDGEIDLAAVAQPRQQPDNTARKGGAANVSQSPPSATEPATPAAERAILPVAVAKGEDTTADNGATRPLMKAGRAARRAERQVRRKLDATNNASGVPAAAGGPRKPLTEDERVARRAQRLERRKLVAEDFAEMPAAALTDAERAARRAERLERKELAAADFSQKSAAAGDRSPSEEERASRRARRLERRKKHPAANPSVASTSPAEARRYTGPADENDTGMAATNELPLSQVNGQRVNAGQHSKGPGEKPLARQVRRPNETAEQFAARQERIRKLLRRRRTRERTSQQKPD